MKLWASEISSRLAGTIESVADELLPEGKRKGSLIRAGDTTGAAGESLALNLTGPKKGKWTDYATGEHGDLLDLWAASKGLTIADAIDDAAKWLGIDTSPEKPETKTYAKPKPNLSALSNIHATWLKSARWLDLNVADRFKLRSNGDRLAFPFFDPDGNLFAVKYRTIDKKMSAEEGCRPGLFGWQALNPNLRTVAITEGELDAIALTQYGIPALSIPNGASSHGWVEHEYDSLARFDTIYLALDNDEHGKKATAHLVDRLGSERCRIVTLPKKDANDCLIEGVTSEEVRSCFESAKALDPAELRKPLDYLTQVENLFYGEKLSDMGFAPPFKQLNNSLRFRPDELIIVAGANATGKSQFCGHLMLEAVRSGFGVCIASMEFRPERYLARMVRQVTGISEPTKEYLRHAMRWMQESMWVFDLTGTAKSDRMIEVFRYARRRYGITTFLIDNLAKCGFAEDDYNGQKQFIDRLTDFAKDTQSIVFLVHHMRKGGTDKDGVKGTGAITDMADTVLTVWRNREKEQEVRAALAERRDPDPKIVDKPDGSIRCEKQRNGEDEPVKHIWFHADSFQFLGGPEAKPFRYCTDFHARAVA
jgi:twinkle protein